MNHLNRRRALTLGGAAMIAAGLPGTRSHAAEPKKGGVVKLGLAGGNTTDSLDPATWASQMMQIGVMGGVYNNLVEIGPNGELTPELAESWEAADGAATWRVKLRRDVEFHNGKSLEAEDVIASINHHRGEDSSSAAKGVVDAITDIRADGKHEVVFSLKSGNADFPYVLNDFHLVIMPAKDGAADWRSGVGTAGYTLESFDPGVKIVLARRDGYWKPNRAHFDGAEILAVSDSTARQNALVSGAVDIINRVDLATLRLLERRPDIVIQEATGTQHFSMPMLTDVAPYDDNNIRLALKHAIDRQAVVDTILLGHGRVGNDHPIAPSQKYFAEDLPQREYDPDKAKFYLGKAGLSSLSVELSAADAAFNGAVDTAILFKEQAAKAGIDVKVAREANDGYWVNVWRKRPFSMCYWGGRPTADWMFSTAYAADANWNDTNWKNERFNTLLVEARTQLDEQKRGEMYREMQQIVRDDGGVVIPAYANYVDAHSDRIAHDEVVGSNWELDGWKVIERWWFA